MGKAGRIDGGILEQTGIDAILVSRLIACQFPA
jgi:hypothetical protein